MEIPVRQYLLWFFTILFIYLNKPEQMSFLSLLHLENSNLLTNNEKYKTLLTYTKNFLIPTYLNLVFVKNQILLTN